MKATMLVWAVTGGLAVISSGGAPGDCDPLFQVGSDLNGEVLSMDLDSQGRLVVGGGFSWVHATLRAGLARLRVDGTVDPDFTPNLGNANGWDRVWVNFCAVQPDGKLFVAGAFTRVDGVDIGTWFHNLVRLDGAGRVDPGFSAWAGCDGWISGALTLADGKVLIWGGFSEVNELPRQHLARLESNGELDHTFVVPDAARWQSVHEVLVQTTGLLLVSAVESDGTSRLLRLAPSGDLDPSFAITFRNEGASPSIHDIALQGDGSILVSGFFQKVNDLSRTNLVRLSPDGEPDPAFECPLGLGDFVNAIQPLQNGRVLLATEFEKHMLRLESNGSVDAGFFRNSAGADGIVNAICLGPPGRIYIGGGFLAVDGVACNCVAELNNEGQLETAYLHQPKGPDEPPDGLALQSDGKILISGGFRFVDGQARPLLARLNADGSTDTSFPSSSEWLDPEEYIWIRPVVDREDRILVTGNFPSILGVPQACLARLLPGGNLDTIFRPVFTFGIEDNPVMVDKAVVQPDGKILVAGWFTEVNGTIRTNLARLNADGTTDLGFEPVQVVPWAGLLADVATLPDSKVLICGNFQAINGLARRGLARLNANGTVDADFMKDLSGVEGLLNHVVPLPDGKILVAGEYSSIHGIPQTLLSRLNPDGSLDTTFAHPLSGAAYVVTQILPQADGKIVISLGFDSVDRPFYPTNVVRLAANGALDAVLAASEPSGADFMSACLQPDGKLVIATESLAGRPGFVFRLMNTFTRVGITAPPESRTTELAGRRAKPGGHLLRSGGQRYARQLFFNTTAPGQPERVYRVQP